MGEGFTPEELRQRRDLDHLVVLDQVRIGKRAELLVLDRLANVTGTLWVNRPYSHVYVTQNVTKERAEKVVERCTTIGVAQVKAAKIGQSHFVKAYLTGPEQRDKLPEEFITDGLAIRAPRTHPYQKHSPNLERTIDRLVELGFPRVEEITRGEPGFRLVRRLRGERSIEMNPMSDPEFATFADLVRSDPILQDEFQTYAYQSPPLRKKDAVTAFKHAKESLNGDRWFRHDFRVIPTMLSGGNRFLLRAYSALYPGVEEPNALEAFSMDLPSGERLQGLVAQEKPKCWSAYRDTAQQAEQRRFLEIAHPAMHSPAGRPLSTQELKEVLRMLPSHILRADTETEDYLKRSDAPRPSGRVWSAPLGSPDWRRYLVAKHRAPSYTEHDGCVVEVCEDAFDILQRVNEYAKPFAYLSMHNGEEFDRGVLSILNNTMSDRKREAWARSVIAQSRHAKDPAFCEAVEEDTKKTQAYIREMRTKHKIRGRVFGHDRMIDTLIPLQKGPRVFVSNRITAVSSPKDRDYAELEEGLDPDADGVYTIEDEEKQRKATTMVLPVLVALSAATGAGLHRVGRAQDYHVMNNKLKNEALDRGKNLRSHVHTRQQDEKEEEAQKKAVQFFRVKTTRKKAFLERAAIWYNPTIPFAFRTELQRCDSLVRMFELAHNEHPYARIRALHAAEHYVASYLEHIKRTLEKHPQAQRNPYHPISSDRFRELLTQTYGDNWPDARLAAEHTFARDFSLFHAYAWLRRTNKDLVESTAASGAVAVGPFIIGDLPARYHSYFVGRGEVAVGNGRMVAVLNDQDADPYLLAHDVFIPRQDDKAMPDIIRALRGEAPLSRPPQRKRLQELYETLAHLGVPSLVTESPILL